MLSRRDFLATCSSTVAMLGTGCVPKQTTHRRTVQRRVAVEYGSAAVDLVRMPFDEMLVGWLQQRIVVAEGIDPCYVHSAYFQRGRDSIALCVYSYVPDGPSHLRCNTDGSPFLKFLAFLDDDYKVVQLSKNGVYQATIRPTADLTEVWGDVEPQCPLLDS